MPLLLFRSVRPWYRSRRHPVEPNHIERFPCHFSRLLVAFEIQPTVVAADVPDSHAIQQIGDSSVCFARSRCTPLWIMPCLYSPGRPDEQTLRRVARRLSGDLTPMQRARGNRRLSNFPGSAWSGASPFRRRSGQRFPVDCRRRKAVLDASLQPDEIQPVVRMAHIRLKSPGYLPIHLRR